jgi:predicted RNA-binding Zn-ribbon protein involved in translation (DUF1610 family)
MDLFVEHKFVGLLSPRLQNFTRKDQNLYNFRCPICGDSHQKKSKSRGYIYERKGSLFYRCHNCGAGMSLGNFIKDQDPTLYKQYVLERYKSGQTGKRLTKTKDAQEAVAGGFDFSPSKKFEKKQKNVFPEDVLRIDSLQENHFAKEYVSARKIPSSANSRIYYASDFKKLISSLTEKEYQLVADDKRLVLPFLNQAGDLIALQGRALSADNGLRYITIKLDDDANKIYGLDEWDATKETFVVEGPIDSLFIPNCLAMAGADAKLDFLDKSKTIIALDNERRNKQIVNRMESLIDAGFKVVIWGDNIVHKDINDMVLAGMQSSDIVEHMKTNAYSGLSAKAKLSIWKRC